MLRERPSAEQTAIDIQIAAKEAVIDSYIAHIAELEEMAGQYRMLLAAHERVLEALRRKRPLQ